MKTINARFDDNFEIVDENGKPIPDSAFAIYKDPPEVVLAIVDQLLSKFGLQVVLVEEESSDCHFFIEKV